MTTLNSLLLSRMRPGLIRRRALRALWFTYALAHVNHPLIKSKYTIKESTHCQCLLRDHALTPSYNISWCTSAGRTALDTSLTENPAPVKSADSDSPE
jgi:hypothetical protein